jgi:hypothetical protein
MCGRSAVPFGDVAVNTATLPITGLVVKVQKKEGYTASALARARSVWAQ